MTTENKEDKKDLFEGLRKQFSDACNDFYNQGLEHAIEIVKQHKDDVFEPIKSSIIKHLQALKK